MYGAALAYRRAGDWEMELLCYAVLCGVTGFLAASFFLSEEYSKQLWIVVALGPALLRASRDQAHQRSAEATRRVRAARTAVRRGRSAAISVAR